jgi:hypothetical protein
MNGDLPRIRQALFIVDKNRNYKFDVNQTITVHNLKKMIVTAANLGKNGLRIFHKGTEYTDMEDSTLADLFPDMQLVEFTLQIVYLSEEERERHIKLRLKDYCPKHNFKYPYFYCYDCQKSICSICLREHTNHNWLEKYDYLQSSRNLVEAIFYDMNEYLSGAKFNNQTELEELRKRITLQFFPQLVEMVHKIETKLVDLIDFFIENNTSSYHNIQSNVTDLKDHCAEGLDKLKSEIAIEDMMLDEQIFLTFDKKFKEISSEKVRIVKDIEKYKELKTALQYVFNAVEKIHNEIYDFLEKYLNVSIYEEIKVKISENFVGVVNREEILNKMLSDVKKKGKMTSSKLFGGSLTPTSQFNLDGGLSRTPKGEQRSTNALTSLQPNQSTQSNNILIFIKIR